MSCNFTKFSLLVKFYLPTTIREEFKYEPFIRNFSIHQKLRLVLVYLQLISLCRHSSKSILLIVNLFYMFKFHVCSREIHNSFMEK